MKLPLTNLLLLYASILLGQGFTEVSMEAGINHAFRVDLANFGGGALVFDYDNDGYEDIYLPAGNDIDKLYRNNGDGTFTDAFYGSGFETTMPLHTQGAAAADIDRDGDKDVIVTTLYDKENRDLTPNLLFINNGNGTFTDVTYEYGLSEFKSNSQGATFGDINLDGYPDLYIANYIGESPKGISIFNEQTITNNYAAAFDYFFINSAGKEFIDATAIYGINHNGFGFQALFTDWDNDRDNDILIANDFGYKARANIALVNDYPENSLSYEEDNLRMNYGMNAMGIARGDFDYDGYMDYYVTNIHASLFALNRDNGKSFIDFGVQSGCAISLINNPQYQGVPVSWGCNFFDYDHDTDLDLFVNNGALNPTVRPNPNFFFENGPVKYIEVGHEKGVDDPRIGRGSVTFDYDNDGDMDLLVVNQFAREPTTMIPKARTLLYRNDSTVGNWLKIKLEGRYTEKDGIGSRVEIEVNGRLLIREVDGGSSHLSQNSTIVHFGLGDATDVDVTVKWLGGHTQVLEGVSTNQQITIAEKELPSTFDEDISIIANPNTISQFTLLSYKLPSEENISVDVYDMSGRLIENLIKTNTPTIQGILKWEPTNDIPSGIYIINLTTSRQSKSIKVLRVSS